MHADTMQAYCSRRELLRRAALAVGVVSVGAALTACGGAAAPSASSSATAAPAGSSAQAKPAEAAAASPSASASAKPAASTPYKLTIGFASPTGTQAPLFVAEAIGAFAKRGLTITTRAVDGPATVPSLLSHDVDVFSTSAVSSITADVNGHTGLVFVAGTHNHTVHSLYVAKSIQSAADLKGKLLATDRPGTANDYAFHVLLGLLGLKLSDVQARPIGSSPTEYQALTSGQVVGAPVAPPISFKASESGFRDLQDGYSVAHLNGGMVVIKSRIDELTPALLALLGGLREGIAAYKSQPDMAMKVIKSYTKISDDVVVKKTYDFYLNDAPFEPSLQPSLPGIQQLLNYLAETEPAAKSAKPEDYVDLRLLPRLPKENV
ncbi:MAG: ABC transporter substrate-binding protein [Chloroflexota bacterium]